MKERMNELKTKTRLCVFGKRNEFTFDVRRKERKEKENTSSNFTQKKQREQDRLHMNDKNYEIHFPCVKKRGR